MWGPPPSEPDFLSRTKAQAQPVSYPTRMEFGGHEMAIPTWRCKERVFSCMIPYEHAVCHALTFRKDVSPILYKEWLRHRLQTQVRIDISVLRGFLFEKV